MTMQQENTESSAGVKALELPCCPPGDPHAIDCPAAPVALPRELVSRAIEHLQTQAIYSPSERNKTALLAVAGELLAHLSGVIASGKAQPDEDEQWAVDRGADLLEHYAAYIHRVKPDEIEAHPYLPELEQVAKDLRALSKRMSADGVETSAGSQPR